MFKKAELEIYDLEQQDIIVTSDPGGDLGDGDPNANLGGDDIVIWPRR